MVVEVTCKITSAVVKQLEAFSTLAQTVAATLLEKEVGLLIIFTLFIASSSVKK